MELLKMRDVARILCVSLSQAYRLAYSGELPIVRMGKSIRVMKSDLEEYIRQHRTFLSPGR